MTKDEFMKKYGHIEVKFSHYYKYVFTFGGTLPDGSKINVEYGGNSDDIYRFEASTDGTETVGGLDPFSGVIYNDGKEIEGFFTTTRSLRND